MIYEVTQKLPLPEESSSLDRSFRREDSVARLVLAGAEMLCEHSYAAMGVDHVLRRTGQSRSKGSFYHFFPSKEAFWLETIKYYADHFYRKLERILDNQSTPALDRLSTYVNEEIVRFNFKRGCLIGNLSQELGPASTVFSLALEDVLQRWQAYVARCLRAVADSGELVSDINEQGRADFFWIGWEGALIRAKASASSDPVRRFASQFIRVLPKSSTVYRRGPAL